MKNRAKAKKRALTKDEKELLTMMLIVLGILFLGGFWALLKWRVL